MGTCSGCPAGWTGIKQAHCPTCHETFSVVANFDLHRVGKKLPLRCAEPSSIGMVQKDNGIWKQPAEQDFAERLANN